MQSVEGVTVGLLRPPSTALSEIFRDAFEENRDPDAARDRELVNDRIDELRGLFEEATERLGIPLKLTEYQLHLNEKGMSLPQGKRARSIRENSILVTVDPTPHEYQFMAGLSCDHLLRRSVVGYTNSDTVLDTASLTATQRLLLFQVDQGREECVNRIFVLHLPLNDSELADRHEKNMSIVESAVRYPYGDTTVLTVPSRKMMGVSETDPLANDGQHFIRS